MGETISTGEELIEMLEAAGRSGIVLDAKAVPDILDLPRGFILPSIDEHGMVVRDSGRTPFVDYLRNLLREEGVRVKNLERLPLSLVRRGRTYDHIFRDTTTFLQKDYKDQVALGIYLYELKRRGFKPSGKMDDILPNTVLPATLSDLRCLEAVLSNTDVMISCCKGWSGEVEKPVYMHSDKTEHYLIGNTWITPQTPLKGALHGRISDYLERKNKSEGKSLKSHSICPRCVKIMYPEME